MTVNKIGKWNRVMTRGDVIVAFIEAEEALTDAEERLAFAEKRFDTAAAALDAANYNMILEDSTILDEYNEANARFNKIKAAMTVAYPRA
jgi:hypothetical protein